MKKEVLELLREKQEIMDQYNNCDDLNRQLLLVTLSLIDRDLARLTEDKTNE